MKYRMRLVMLISSCLSFTSACSNNTIKADDQFQTILNKNGPRNWNMISGKPFVQELKNGAVTYSIDTKDPYYAKIFKAAVKDWNDLGIIRFVKVSNDQSEIKMSGSQNDPRGPNKAYGITTWNWDSNFGDSKQVFMKNTQITMYGHILKDDHLKYRFKYIKEITEHEIGHALGFAHDDSEDRYHYFRIMKAHTDYLFVNSTNQLGKYEKKTLVQHYQDQPEEQEDDK